VTSILAQRVVLDRDGVINVRTGNRRATEGRLAARGMRSEVHGDLLALARAFTAK